ncbi:hypothetical protein VIN30_10405 [Adlercreutzia sp. R7]|uniref:Uncharacterized protein n=1 Tax=Adlercreutzia wanghongyangiae TaxID=3111451 RepID=A0ABU6IKC0_9ACTN|nr:hypothetical protein [Adlercreutzia sp. R7]
MNDMKAMARPFLTLYALAAIIALLGRIALTVAGGTGVLAFDYISASGVPILDVICSILTGSAFVAFLFAAGLALVVSTAGAVLYGVLAARGTARPRPLTAFLWGWATALVAIVCLALVVLGILSAVQVGSMSSKLPGLPVIIAGVIVFAAFLGTLLGAASMVISACVARARAGRSLEASLLVACAGCGAVVAALTLGTFSALNAAAVSLPALGAWVAADVIVNLAMLFGAAAYRGKLEGATAATAAPRQASAA